MGKAAGCWRLLGSWQEEGVEVPVQGSSTRAATGMPEDAAAWWTQELGSSQEMVETEDAPEIEQHHGGEDLESGSSSVGSPGSCTGPLHVEQTRVGALASCYIRSRHPSQFLFTPFSWR